MLKIGLYEHLTVTGETCITMIFKIVFITKIGINVSWRGLKALFIFSRWFDDHAFIDGKARYSVILSHVETLRFP